MECPKCRKTFDHKWPSKAREKLEAHLARKNPCDRRPKDPYVIVRRPSDPRPVPSLETLQPAGSVVLDNYIVFSHIISKSFDLMNSHETFACMPNIDRNQVLYIFGNELRRSPLIGFIDVWIMEVFIKKVIPHLTSTWDRWPNFHNHVSETIGWCMRSSGIQLGEWKLLKRSELYRRTCDAIRGHLGRPTKATRTELRLRMNEMPEGQGEMVSSLIS